MKGKERRGEEKEGEGRGGEGRRGKERGGGVRGRRGEEGEGGEERKRDERKRKIQSQPFPWALSSFVYKKLRLGNRLRLLSISFVIQSYNDRSKEWVKKSQPLTSVRVGMVV